jgi:oligoendopeptidase F
MKPQGGWVDLETLLHEMGHGLSSVLTSPCLSLVDREMTTTFCLSEAFAFLFQNLSHSIPFLVDHLGLNKTDAEKIRYLGFLKDLSLFRRYAGKFVSEYEMFLNGNIEDGERYSHVMGQYTGFHHQPNSHLLDLVPEFYSLDYVLAWMASPILSGHLREMMGSGWLEKIETGNILRKWWSQGNQYDIFEFHKINGLEALNPDPLLEGWKRVLGGGSSFPLGNSPKGS